MNYIIFLQKIIILVTLLTIAPHSFISATIDGSKNNSDIGIENDISNLLDSCWHYRTENPHLALDFVNKALTIIDKNNYLKLKPKTLNFLGVVNRKLGNLLNAYNYFKSALNLAEELKDSVQIGYTYNNLTDYYIEKASYSTALENVLMGYQIFRSLNHKIGMAYSLNYLGEIYIQQGDFNKAIKYLEESSVLRFELDDQRGYSNTLVNIGIIYFKQHNFDKAKEYYTKAIKINKSIKYEKGNSYIVALLADIHYYNKDYDNALKSFKFALDFAKKTNDKNGIIEYSNKIGLVYLKLKNLDKAKNSFNLALKLAKEFGHLDEEMFSYLYLSEYYSETKRFETSLSCLNKYIILKDSIYSNEKLGRFADLQTLFEDQNNQIETKLLKHEIESEKLRNNYLILIFIIVVVAIILLISKYKIQKKSNTILEELNDSKDKFFSILAHDLKNPFQALMGYTDMLSEDFDQFSNDEIKNSIQSLQSISHNVYNLLEGVLEWSRAQTGRMEFNPTNFILAEELNSIIELYKHSADAKEIKLITEVDPTVSLFADRNMIKTILRNLVANGLKFTKSGGSVKIIAQKHKNEVQIIVADTGIGINSKVIPTLFRIDSHHTTKGTNGEEGTGVGLMLCFELVKQHKGKIWAESELGKGSKFIFTIPS